MRPSRHDSQFALYGGLCSAVISMNRLAKSAPTPRNVMAAVDSPYYPPLSDVDERLQNDPDFGAGLACTTARKFGGPAYALSHFVTHTK